MSTDDEMKVAVCEALLDINAADPARPIIPPTAIDWIGNRIASSAIEVTEQAVQAERQRIFDAFDAVLKRRQRPADQVEFADFLRLIVEDTLSTEIKGSPK